MQKEIVQELFFPAPTLDSDGYTVPAPQEVILFQQAMRNGWLRDYPRRPGVYPSVGIHLVRQPDREGYVVQKMLVRR
jgi:hypothetical protein